MKKLASATAAMALLGASALVPVSEANGGTGPGESLAYRHCIDDLAAGLVRDCTDLEGQSEPPAEPKPGVSRESLSYRHCIDDSAAGLVFDCSDLAPVDDA